MLVIQKIVDREKDRLYQSSNLATSASLMKQIGVSRTSNLRTDDSHLANEVRRLNEEAQIYRVLN